VVVSKSSVNNNPTLNGAGVTKLVSSGTTGVFTVGATGLDVNTAYSFKAYATSAAGTGYSAVSPFSTLNAPSVSSTAPVAGTLSTATSAIFTVTFSEPVTGVDASDFKLATTGTAVGTIGAVTGSGTPTSVQYFTTYSVQVTGISGDYGTLALAVNPSGTGIENASNVGLNGGYTAGTVHYVDNIETKVTDFTFDRGLTDSSEIKDGNLTLSLYFNKDMADATLTVNVDSKAFNKDGTVNNFSTFQSPLTFNQDGIDKTKYTAIVPVSSFGMLQGSHKVSLKNIGGTSLSGVANSTANPNIQKTVYIDTVAPAVSFVVKNGNGQDVTAQRIGAIDAEERGEAGGVVRLDSAEGGLRGE
jgi:hypothetical protein